MIPLVCLDLLVREALVKISALPRKMPPIYGPVLGLLAGLLLLSGCGWSRGKSPAPGEPRDKVIAAYGEPDARQINHNIEVWQYCRARGAGESLDHLHLVWLMDGTVVRESRH